MLKKPADYYYYHRPPTSEEMNFEPSLTKRTIDGQFAYYSIEHVAIEKVNEVMEWIRQAVRKYED